MAISLKDHGKREVEVERLDSWFSRISQKICFLTPTTIRLHMLCCWYIVVHTRAFSFSSSFA